MCRKLNVILTSCLMISAMLLLPGCTDSQESSTSVSSNAASSSGSIEQSSDNSNSVSPDAVIEYTDKDVSNVYINDSKHLILVLKDNTELDAGLTANGKTPPISYSVTFRDYDGTVLKAASVLIGQSAIPPAAPQRQGFEFVGWDGSFSHVRENRLLVAQYRALSPEQDTTFHTITFLDRDASVLKTQLVEDGQAAAAPIPPHWDGFVFLNWDREFQNVRSDLTVTAQYEMDHSMTIYADHLTASPGDTVVMPVWIQNNTGVLSLHMLLRYPEAALELTSIKSGDAFSMLDFVPHGGELSNGSGVIWSKIDITPEEIRDGEILLMTFHVIEDACKGTCPVSFVCKDVFDRELKPMELNLLAGSIRIE